jgi:hypothetical protein
MNKKGITFTHTRYLKNLFMPFYNYFFLLIMLSIIILLILFLVHRKKNIPVELFLEALRNENNGHFEEAVITYETALNEVSKIRFHGTLKNKIIQKLNLLHTVIEYKNNQHFIR